LTNGDLDLGLGGNNVSDMSYACSKVIENDTNYNATVAASENANSTSNGGTVI